MQTGLINVAASPGSSQIGDREFRLFRDVIQSETGIHLKDVKRTLVASRLSKRLRVLGLATFSEYYKRLQGPGRADELRELINCITTNKTSFFREATHFDFLRRWLMRPETPIPSRPLRIWCAACSTGEEPYTIAMTALDVLGGGRGVRIL